MRKELGYLTYFRLKGENGGCEADSYINLEDFEFADLFREDEPAWEVIKRLSDYVALLFGNRRVKRISSRVRKEYEEKFIIVERNVSIGQGTTICEFTSIKNDVVIGKNCLIGQNVLLRGPLILGDGCIIGYGGEVVASVFLPGAIAAHQNFVGHSILGRGVNLGAGAKTANWKLDESEISVISPEGRIFTGLKKFGAVVGDGCSIGCNSVLNPGALLGKSCRVGPLVAVPNCFFPKGTVIRKEA